MINKSMVVKRLAFIEDALNLLKSFLPLRLTWFSSRRLSLFYSLRQLKVYVFLKRAGRLWMII
ncbi:MAG: hypothetical protein A2042_08895 [Candidatus Schekmanbacteria bacterium GWA2_38_11]|uniref:Uncharacterized protein n=1 Tax=Candidatus Schekmanbacteria bacterium GWA2_38_11 TaxID=1817876 RepID=A0A1F7R9W5_9BACT|nr:MAG: hypothetical protein A2042_08895 [Candidatus Schekmanbacteria bacterium GWA2_38_11]